MSSPSFKVPFGLRHGELFEPGQVENGKACQCVCPGCGLPLIAYNRGTSKAHHFGHSPGVDCAKGLESAVHLAAKHAVVAARRFRLPDFVVDCDGIAPIEHRPLWHRIIEPSTVASYDAVELEVAISVTPPTPALPAQADLFATTHAPPPVSPVTLRPDVRGSRAGLVDWIEIRVTHAVDAPKRRLLQQAGVRAIEVDLRKFLRASVSLAEIHRAVVDDVDGKIWLAHPSTISAAAALTSDFERHVALSEMSHIWSTPTPRR